MTFLCVAGSARSTTGPEGNLIISQTTLPPYSLSSQYTSGNLSNPGGGTVAQPAPMGTIHGIDPNLKTPLMYTFNTEVRAKFRGHGSSMSPMPVTRGVT